MSPVYGGFRCVDVTHPSCPVPQCDGVTLLGEVHSSWLLYIIDLVLTDCVG